MRVELSGEYDLSRREELAAVFGALAGDKAPVIDLKRVTYVDSTFLHELFNLRQQFAEIPVTLNAPTAYVTRLLKLMRFDLLFRIENAEEMPHSA